MVPAGQEEPKDVGSLKRYQSIKSSEENVRMPKEGIIKIFSKLIMKRTGHLVPVGSGRNRLLTRFLSELMQVFRHTSTSDSFPSVSIRYVQITQGNFMFNSPTSIKRPPSY